MQASINKFKTNFKLEFDIRTNVENMKKILDIIVSNVGKEFEEKIKDKTKVSIVPTITKVEV